MAVGGRFRQVERGGGFLMFFCFFLWRRQDYNVAFRSSETETRIRLQLSVHSAHSVQ